MADKQTISPEKDSGNPKKTIFQGVMIIKKEGGYTILKSRYNLEVAEEWARQEYDKIRADHADSIKVAQHTGLPIESIVSIKYHIFFDKYYLDSEYTNLDPDPEQAEAWIRLRDGDFVQNDVQWLLHEQIKAQLLNSSGKKVVRAVHDIMTGYYDWTPPLLKGE